MRFSLLSLLSVSLFAADAPAKTPITAADMLKIRRVASVQVAHDGSFAVYSVQSMYSEPGSGANAKTDPQYGYRTHLFYINLNDASAKPVQLTFGDRNDADPQISPDGSRLAFVRDDGKKEQPKAQIWLMPLKTPGEAELITKLEEGAGSPRWRPDGQALLVTSLIPISKLEAKPHFNEERPERDWFDWDRPAPKSGEKAGEDVRPEKIDIRPDGDRRAIRNWLERNASRDNPTDITRINFLAEQGLQREMRIAELFLVDLANGNKATQLTRTTYNHGDPQFSPDGKQIVFVSTPEGSKHPDREARRSSLWILNADGSGEKILLSSDHYSFLSPRYTADGKSLYFLTQQADEPGFRQTKIARVNLATKAVEPSAADWDPSVSNLRVASDGSVLFATNFQGTEPLKRIAPDSHEPVSLTSGPTGVNAYDEGAGRVVFAMISVPDPNELYLRDRNGAIRQLTDLNESWLRTKELSLPEEHWLTRPDGTRVQYWVMNPTHPERGKKYPWVLDMHGGPTAMWGPGEFSMWHEFQTFCAWGYGVVYANPRGSGGYGYAFQKGNFKNWGDGPAGDVLAALDETVKDNIYVDKDRLFLTGGSYAGYLTAWIIGHDQRFKAAAAQRGVYELSTFYGEGNAYRLVENSFGGFPWEPETKKVLDHESPFTYVASIKTPFLIIHGSQDLRTGYAQSEMLFKALKQLERPVEYIRYPNIGHELTRSGPPLQRMDHMLRIVEFFERYAKNDRAAPMEAK